MEIGEFLCALRVTEPPLPPWKGYESAPASIDKQRNLSGSMIWGKPTSFFFFQRKSLQFNGDIGDKKENDKTPLPEKGVISLMLVWNPPTKQPGGGGGVN